MVLRVQINAILNRPMDRGDFLKTLAIGAAVVLGLGWLVRLMPRQQVSLADSDYGDTAYGGTVERSSHGNSKKVI